MNLDEKIYELLSSAGHNGLSAKKLSVHVFNACNGFFDVISYDDVYTYVLSYLRRNSKKRYSLLERAEKRGHYRLNSNHDAGIRSLFDIIAEEQTEEQHTVSESEISYPSLFAEE